jgi:hypothetical protein
MSAVDRLIDRWRRIDRLAVRPHVLVPTFVWQLVRRSDLGLPFGPCFGSWREDRSQGTGAAEFSSESFSVAPGKRGRVVGP